MPKIYHILEIKEDIKNYRLDRYLRLIFPSLTQGIIEKSLREKKIKVNDNYISSSFRINQSDNIAFLYSLWEEFQKYTNRSLKRTYNIVNISPAIIKLANNLFTKYLIYEDQNIIAIDKPANLAVQGGEKITISIDHALAYLNAKNQNDNYSNLRLVHRIDKETSGILLIAKNLQAAELITKAFKERIIKKTYIALLNELITKDCGVIETKIKTEENNQEKNKPAITYYKLIKNIKINQKNYSLIEFSPITGRKHQLRIHALEIGGSIVGDKKYSNKQEKINGKLFLHAKKIIIPKNLFNKEIIINSKIPKIFFDYL